MVTAGSPYPCQPCPGRRVTPRVLHTLVLPDYHGSQSISEVLALSKSPEKFRVSNSVSGSTIKICSICLWSYCKYFFDIITIEFFSEPYLWTHWFLKNFFVKGKQQLIHAMIFLYEENCLSTGSIQAKVLLQAPCSAQIPITTWLSIKSASDIWNSRLILCWYSSASKGINSFCSL